MGQEKKDNTFDNPLFAKAVKIAHAVQEEGGRALLVGGYVRDALLGFSPKDADLEVYGIEAETLRELLKKFGRVDCVGESFRVYKLVWRNKNTSGERARHELDVTLPRRDKKVGSGHRGFEIEGDPFASIEDATRRRDFTVNAILQDPLTQEIIDPFGGQADLDKRELRIVDAAHFAEDSLRVLRAVQFAARFDMTIEARSAALCRSIDLSDLPCERVWGEVEKWLLKSNRPSIGLQAARELGVLQQLFPAIDEALARRAQEMQDTLDRAARERNDLPGPKQTALMLAALGIFLGKNELEAFLQSLGIFTIGGYDVRRQTIILSGERKRIRDWFRTKDEIADREFRFVAARLEPQMLYKLARARGDFEAAAWFKEKMSALEVWHGPPAPFLLGRNLLEMGLKPGPRIGEILQTIWIAQLSGDVTTFEMAQTMARTMIEETSHA